MRLKVAAFAVFVTALCAGAPVAAADAQPSIVYVQNTGTFLTQEQIANALPAFQQALDEDFSRFYGPDPQLVLLDSSQTIPVGGWVIILQDSIDNCWCLGFHDVAKGTPFARVETNDPLWTLTFTHELFEMLADPFVDRLGSPSFSKTPPSKEYIYEVCDPVEDSKYAWTLPGADGTPVTISDFVTDRWFSGQGGGPMDAAGFVRHAGQVLPGGYIWEWIGGVWKDIQK